MVVEEAPTTQRAPAKGRILDTASVLFYEDGIRNVGVDRIIAASSVTKATFYKHYRAKDNLIVEYINARSRTVQEHVQSIVDASDGAARALAQLVADTAEHISSPGFRGCAFLNAAAEFPNPEHPVRRVVTAHRDWYAGALEDLLRQLGHPAPGDGADELVLARDGAMSGGYAGDSIAATAALTRVASRVINDAR